MLSVVQCKGRGGVRVYRAVGRLCKVGQLCVNEVDIKGKFLATTPTFSAMNRRRNLRKCGNNYSRSSSKFAIAIVLTKQTMGVTVIIRVIIPGSKVTVQEKVGRLKPPQPPRFLRPCTIGGDSSVRHLIQICNLATGSKVKGRVLGSDRPANYRLRNHYVFTPKLLL